MTSSLSVASVVEHSIRFMRTREPDKTPTVRLLATSIVAEMLRFLQELWLMQTMIEENIKNYCVSCGKEIPGTKDWYEKRGNYCQACNSEAASIVYNGKHKDARKRIRERLGKIGSNNYDNRWCKY